MQNYKGNLRNSHNKSIGAMPDSMMNGIINQNNSAEAHLEPMQINHHMPMNDNLLESINGPNDS